MQITSIEVIRGNPTVPNSVAVGVLAGEKLPVSVGDIVRVHMTVDHRGPARDGAVWTAIGWQVGVIIPEFIEVFNSRTPVHFDESLEFVTYEIDCDVPITDITGFLIEFGLYGNILDMYAKIMEVPGPDIFTGINMGAFEVVPGEVPPWYELIQHTIHPAAYVYEGDTEVCVIEFPLTPEQIPFTQWGGLKLADAFASAVEAEGNSILELKVYEDTTPIFWTNYRVEIKAAVASEEQGVAAPVWPWLVAIGAILVKLPWAFIIKGTLTLLGIWLVGWVIERLIKSVDRVIHKPPALTDEIIEELGREDLIPMILYKAPRVDYEVSPEDLEQMTDEGLRALLKDLRDRQVAKEAEWWPLAIVGGIAVLGIGVAVALATRRK
ncbi:hypothetical protein ES703_08349 [subsurface metagenome]